MDAIRKEIGTVRCFFNDMKRANLRKGDRFTAGSDIRYHGSNNITYSGSELMPFVRRGILKVVGREFVTFGDGYIPPMVINPADILSGTIKGLFYTRNVYEVEYDNFENYITNLMNNYL